VVPGSISFILKDSNGNTIPTTLSYDGSTFRATLTANTPLNYLTTYSATVTGAVDLSGNVMASPVSWSFTTLAAPVLPKVVSETPSPNATGVSTGTSVTAIFNESIS